MALSEAARLPAREKGVPVTSSAFEERDELGVDVVLLDREVGGVAVGEDPGEVVYGPHGEQDVGRQASPGRRSRS